MPQQVNQGQVAGILKYIDAVLDETIKADISTELGRECFAVGAR